MLYTLRIHESRPASEHWTAQHNEGLISVMHIPSYRRLLLTAAAAVTLFAIPASASADSTPPVLGGPAPSVTQSAAPEVPLGAADPSALGSTQPTPTQPAVIYPVGTVMVSDGMGGVLPVFDRS